MKSFVIPAFLGLFLTAAPALAQFHPEVHRAYEAHWRAHPEHPEQLARLWHERLFRRNIPAPLLDRCLGELRRGIEAPLALAHVLGSAEYYATVGGTAEGFVRRTFIEIVGRPPTEAEFRFWLQRLYHSDRSDVAYEMVTRYPPSWAVEEAAPVETYEYRRPVVVYPPR